MGLNDVYEQTRRHILMLKPIPSIDDVFNLVSQDERQKNIKPTQRIENPVFQASVSSEQMSYPASVENAAFAAQFRPNQRPVCTHCGKVGHTIQKCYKLNGYPPGHRLASRSNSQQYNQSVRNVVQQSGTHSSQFQTPANQHTKTNTVANVIAAPVAGNTLDLSKFTTAQVQALINQLTAQTRVPESPSPILAASITEQGFMAPQSVS
ncbi:hypothetical protein N665_0079s0006, partial [Sinapis alba]